MSAVAVVADPVPSSEIVPVRASAGTVAVIWVGESIVKAAVAADPTNPMPVTDARLVPVIVTVEPGAAVAGANEVIVAFPAKSAPVAAVPAGVVTLIGPVGALAGTVACTEVADSTVNAAAGVLPNRTALVPERFAPVRVTTVPAAPFVGENPVSATDDTAKVPPEVLVLTGVVTVTRPLTAFAGTVTVIVVADTDVG